MGQDENTNPFNGNETPVFETPTPTPAPAPTLEAPVAPAPTLEPTPAPEAPAPAPAPIPVTKPGQVSESVSQLSSYNRLGMRPSRNLSAREELDRIAPKAPAPTAAVSKEKAPRDPKIKVIIVLVIVTAIALVAMLVISAMSGNGGIFGGKKNSAATTSGEANLDVIFDDKAYLPYYENGLWGYKNPENGEVVIKAKYTAAERFYGDYAAVSFVDGDTAKSAIIDKEGNVKLEQDNGSSATEMRYEVEKGVWYLGDNVYDESLRQLNDDGTIGKYLGAGYVSNSIKYEKDGPVVYITDSSKKRIYDCTTVCSAFVSEDGNHVAINDYGKQPKILGLPSGEEKYVSESVDDRIMLVEKNVFMERKKNGVEKFLVIENGVEIKETYKQDKLVLPAGYEMNVCENTSLSVSKGDAVIIDCVANNITGPSQSVRLRMDQMSKEYILYHKQASLVVYDLKNGSEIRVFGNASEYNYTRDSSILYVKSEGKRILCNLFEPSKILELPDDSKVFIRNNYILLEQGDIIKTYSNNLKEI